MLPEGLKQAFQKHGQSDDDLCKIGEIYDELASRTEPSRRTPPGDYGQPERIKANVLIYRQVLLHRAISLFEGALNAAVDENLYSVVLNMRGHFETTASLGYLYRRLQSLKKGVISAERIDRDLCAQLLGTRREGLRGAPAPINILTAFEEADKALNIAILQGTTHQYEILKNSYEYLCEFCHPNLSSNSIALDLDKSVPEFRFRHGQDMRDHEFNLIVYIVISANVFLSLYDQILDLLPSE